MTSLVPLSLAKRRVKKARDRFIFDVENVKLQQAWKPKILRRTEQIKQKLSPIYPPWKENFMPENVYDRMFVVGTRPNAIVRLCRNILIVETFGILCFLSFGMKYSTMPHLMGTYWSIGTHCVLSLMIVCPNLMKYVTITSFRMLAGKTRTLLLLIMLVLALEHNLMNATQNVSLMASGAVCVQNSLNEGQREFKLSMANVMDMFSPSRLLDMQKWIYAPMQRMYKLIRNLWDSGQRFAETVKRNAGSLSKITHKCKALFAGPYRKCLNTFNEAYLKCHSWDFMFNVGLCKYVANANKICDVSKSLTDKVCVFPQTVMDKLKNNFVPFYKKAFTTWIGWAKKLFGFKTLVMLKDSLMDIQNFNATMSFDKGNITSDLKSKGQELKDRMLGEIQVYLDFIAQVSKIFNMLIIPVLMLYPIFTTAYMLTRYNTDEKYRNNYVNEELRKIERDRVLKGERGIFPLTKEEREKYTSIRAWRMTLYEKTKFLLTFVLTILYGMAPLLFIAIDVSVYLISQAAYKTIQNTTIKIPDHWKLKIDGKGFWSEFLKKLMDIFSPISDAITGENNGWRACFLEPTPPNYELIFGIFYMYFFAIFLSRFEIWLSRQWLPLADYFYPHRVRPRALYLYNYILFQRRLVKPATQKTNRELLARDQLDGRDEMIRRGLQSRGKCLVHCSKCIRRELRVADHNNTRICQECGAFYCIECFCFCLICTRCGQDMQYLGRLRLHYEVDEYEGMEEEESEHPPTVVTSSTSSEESKKTTVNSTQKSTVKDEKLNMKK